MSRIDERLRDQQLAGRHITVMGLGRHGGGVAATRFLAARGARVTVSDTVDAHALKGSLKQLHGAALHALHLGGHRVEDFCSAEVVVVNPAVRPDNPFVKSAEASGARITSEIELFLERCEGTVIGVTGSNGKTTTAAMTAAILEAAGRKVWLGGNIECSLLPNVYSISREDVVVLELSSFQLWWLGQSARRPHIAVVTGCAPNHLDWHGTYREYVSAKQRILDETPQQIVVLARGRFGLAETEFADWHSCVHGEVRELKRCDLLPPLPIPGDHNRHNAACAAAAAEAAGCDNRAIRTALGSFQGLPHRLEVIGTLAGRQIINDSQATTPEATIAALTSLDGRCWLSVGGADKGADYGNLIAVIANYAAGAVFYGAVGDRLYRQMCKRDPSFPCERTDALEEAVAWCFQRSSPGDVLLLSPACSSHDQYRDYADRAADFLRAARRICGSARRHASAADLL